MLARGASLNDILTALSHLIEAHSDGMICSILVCRQDKTRFTIGVAPGLPDAYLEAIADFPITPLYVSPCCRVADCDEVVITADIAVDQRWSKTWRDLAISHGLRTSYCVPIRGSDCNVLGSFGIYYRQLRDPMPSNMALIQTATQLAGLAIERRRAEETRHELTERYAEQSQFFSRLFSSITDFTYSLDLKGRFTFANKAMLDLWGLSLQQAVGKNFIELEYPDELARELQGNVQKVIDTRRHLVGETPYTSPKGIGGYYEYIFTPVFSANGSIEAVSGSSRDITERKQIEEKLRLLAVDNEILLASERESRAAAEAANRAKDKFLAVLSHELRTPLTPVLLTATAQEMNEDLPSDVRADMKMIRLNVELETKLIDDLLDISRITSGKLRLDLDTLDINGLVQHVCAMCRSNLLEKGIRLHCDLDQSAGVVSGDSARLHQVFWNLLNNATKFTPQGGEIEVKTEKIGDGRVRVSVRDSGIGIPPEVLPRIFDAFEQGQAGITRHLTGDWGEVPPEDRIANDRALVEGTRILSAYSSANGVKFWIITEADRSVTTVLLPEDY